MARRMPCLVQRAGEIDWAAMRGVSIDRHLRRALRRPRSSCRRSSTRFRDRFDVTVDIALTVEETENFPVMRDLRDTELGPADMAFLNGTNS
jgi:4-hydroxy-3-methylbut-2-enyl diphosphate reductase